MHSIKSKQALGLLLMGALLGAVGTRVLLPAHAQAPETHINADDDALMFIVAGQERARLDAAGFHVNGDINYSGALTDTVTYIPAAHAPEAGGQ